MTFALTLRTIRKHRKMTQAEAASKVGITREHLCYIENGKRDPSMELLEKLAALYQTRIEFKYVAE